MVNYVSQQTVAGFTVSSLIKSVYMQMAAALSITGLVAYFLSQSVAFWQILAENMSLIWVIFIAQIGLVIWLSARITKMSMTSATLLFILYSVLMGVTMSTIFMVYTMGSIASVFFITAGMFLAMSLIGEMFTIFSTIADERSICDIISKLNPNAIICLLKEESILSWLA